MSPSTEAQFGLYEEAMTSTRKKQKMVLIIYNYFFIQHQG